MSGTSSSELPRAGDVIAAKYAIVRVLGEGGMGVVYEASHVRLRQRVAIKMLLPEMLAHPILVERFEREARAAAQLRGRHVARVSDVDVTSDGMPYMVMEFLEGWDLQREMESRAALPFPEAVDYVLQACAAMAEAHALGIVHRDLKPSNLFLANDGGVRVVKALDFGISKVSNDRDVKITDAHAVMGTALYMSPEQVKASHSVDARTDIWALGVILYEAIAGRVPFMGTPTQIAAAIVTEDAPDVRTFAQLPAELAVVLNKTLQREPSNRFSDVRQLAVALAPFAPQGSIGRAYAESLVGTESGSFRSLVPPSPSSGHAVAGPDHAPTVMNFAPPPHDSDRRASLAPGASARSESRMRPDGTAPGWSQYGADTRKKNRGLLLGAGIAFVVALVAIGGGLLAMRASSKKAPTAPVAATSANGPPVLADPTPPSLDQPSTPSTPSQPTPPPPTTAAEVTAAPAVPAKATPTKPATKPASAPATTTTAHAPAGAPHPPPASSGAKDKDGKPLFL